jgi:hypothetical protein
MRRFSAILCAVLCPVLLTACSSTASSSSFKGAAHEAAQPVANLQADATSGNEKKICANDLSSSIVAGLGGKSGCEAAIKARLEETDNLELTIESVTVAPSGTSASVKVNGLRSGKKQIETVPVVKQDGSWKISGL